MEIVAELSCNHLGSLDRALETIQEAKRAGADAVKLQCWHPDLMVIDKSYVLPSGAWAGRNLYDLYQEAWTPWEWFPILFDKAKAIGIECFASVFDTEALHFLESLGCPRYKIASFEALDLPLVKAVADTGKPVIVSSGFLRDDDVVEVYGACGNLTLLHCVSEYPALPSQYLLSQVHRLRYHADRVGVSDHTLGAVVPMVAAVLNVGMLEKHFTLDRSHGGLDAAFSVEPTEMRQIVDMCRDAEACMQHRGLARPSEQAMSLARSLYITEPLCKGDRLDQAFIDQHVRSARPALGMSPNDIGKLAGKVVTCDLPAGSPLTWGVLCDANELAQSHR